VNEFEDLQNFGGIDYIANSRNYITGDWRIDTSFTANREAARIEPNLTFETLHPDVFIILRHVEVSLLNTIIAYDLVDGEGRRVRDPFLQSRYFHQGRWPHEINDFKLLYDNGEYLDLSYFWQAGIGVREDWLYTIMYNIQWGDFTTDTFTLMNTNRLQAIVIAGEIFEI
jgi:hypothetical protein